MSLHRSSARVDPMLAFWLLLLSLGIFSASLASAADGQAGIPTIDYEKFVLDNGLTLVVHEDHKAPIVAINVWYHVGSKDEKLGRTGFAHLFEHLMFNGSENYNDDYFKAYDRVGATEMNGTTDSDRTNYFQNVPVSSLDMALWMESDRMGHLKGAIDQDRLDEQRGVVQNEKRQGENQPYGRVFSQIVENAYPNGHPYSWSTIGRMEDLEAASLEDVHEWFERYYGAANAVLVVAGDVEAQDVLERVEHYFGDIPSGPPIARQESWVAKMSGTHHVTIEDRVPQARTVRVWNTPPITSPQTDYLELAASILADGKTSRLYKRLVYEEQIASDVVAFNWTKELGSQFVVWATVLPGEDKAAVSQAIEEEIARFAADGPTEAELKRVQTQWRADFLRGIERIGGFSGKSDLLARSEIYGGSPDFYKQQLDRKLGARVEDIQRASHDWLTDGLLALDVVPFPEYKTASTGADRSGLPPSGTPPQPDFPKLERTTLDNGLEIILAERHSVPLVSMALVVDAGFAADAGRLPGTTNLVMDMLDEGTTSRDALEISEQLTLLGAELTARASLDSAYVRLYALGENLDASLDLFADIVLHPDFPEDELARKKIQQLAAIDREKLDPFFMALRVFPPLIYGDGHAYAVPFTGSGTAESVPKIDRQTLATYHRDWFKPNNATLIVTGDTTLSEIEPKLARLFGSWKQGSVPTKNIGDVDMPTGRPLYLIDRPDALQSIIVCGHVVPPKANPDEAAIETMNQVLGGGFTSRINMNLREDKHWSYGASSFMLDARGQRPYLAMAPVQTDKTKESLLELRKEIMGIMGDNPPTPAEVAKAKDLQTLTLPGRWETQRAVLGAIIEMVEFDLPEDHWTAYPATIQELSEAQVAEAAREILTPAQTVWVVVGDRAKIEPGLREIGFDNIQVIDADGQLITAGSGSSVGSTP